MGKQITPLPGYAPRGSRWMITCPVTCGYGQAPHLRNWVIGKGVQMKSQMEECDSDGEVACKLLVGIQLCSRLDKKWVPRIPVPEMQAMVAFKNCVWLVVLRSVGYSWIVGGWIYSKPVGWLVCLLLSIDWSDGCRMVSGWLAGWFVSYPVCRSVGRSNYPAGLLSNLSPPVHPSVYIWSLTNRSKNVLVQVTSACISGIGTGVRCISVFVWAVGCGGGTWPMSASHWSSLGRFSSSHSSQWRI